MTGVSSQPRPAVREQDAPPRRPPRYLRTAFVSVAVLAVGVHLVAIAALRTITHDDAISYMAATGHEGAYAAVLDDPDGLTAQWVPARAWKSFVQVEDRFIFDRIRRDLVGHDIHPPLYFWLLHLAVAAVGVHVGTGPALNVLLHLVTAVALWRLGRRVFVSPIPALAAVLLWAVSPAVVSTGLATRPYSLMALAAVVLALQCLDLAEPGARVSPQRLAGIALVTAVGFATQFQFGVVAAATCGWVVVRRFLGGGVRRGLPAVAAVAAAATAGAAAAVLVTGDVLTMIARQQDQAEPFTGAELSLRLPWVPTALSELVWHDPSLPAGVTVGTLLILAGAATALLVVRRAHRADGEVRPAAALGVVWCFGVVAAGTLGAYLAGVSPRFAVEPRYLAPVWPFAALTLVTLWVVGMRSVPDRVAPRMRRVLITAAVVMGVGMVASAGPLLRPSDEDPSAAFASAGAVVTDNVARGVLPRVVWHLPDDKPVRAAPPHELARSRTAFEPPAGGPTLYVSVPGYAVVPPARERVLRSAARQGRVEPVDGSVWGIGDFFVVR